MNQETKSESSPTALEVKEDGQIYVIDGYHKAMLAPRLLVSNQEVAKDLLWRHDERIHNPMPFLFWKENIMKPGIYPIPGLKWELGFQYQEPQTEFRDCDVTVYQEYQALNWKGHKSRKVAIVSPPESEKEKQKRLLIEIIKEDEKNGMYEESQEELIDELIGHTFGADLPGRQAIKELFTITRRKP